jgi:acyl-CoA synthetase (AMP-forming)/AMP-acid ligase II
VSGVANEAFGMVPKAEIVTKAQHLPPSKGELSKHCRNLLSAYKVPVLFDFVTEIPKTPSGKVLRRANA